MSKTLKPCTCSLFTAYNTESEATYTTGCNKQTTRDFAPGHDARLKGNLIRWEVLGYEIRKGDVTADAVTHASAFGFAHQVAAGLKRSADRVKANAERIAKKAAPKPEAKLAEKAKVVRTRKAK